MNKKLLLITVIFLLLQSCKKDFYNTLPPGQLSTEQVKSKAGVEKLLIAAYSQLYGSGPGASPMNWMYGDLASDDATSGINPYEIEKYQTNANNADVANKWRTTYEGVERCNDVLRIMSQVPSIGDADRKRISAETRFLRGYYYFELRRIFYRVPYLDETTTEPRQPNTEEIYPKIEADFSYAADNLPPTQSEIGRINSWGARAFLAKVLLYERKFADAKTALDDVIANGVTSSGEKYGLMDCFRDAFDVQKKNNRESVFAIQMSINDGSDNAHANNANWETYPRIQDPGGLKLFYGANLNASQNLVDAFKTDAQGLPLFNTFDDTHLKNDDGVLSGDAYEPDITTLVDPRLDWTVSRRGIPYLGWGENPGVQWNGGYGLQGGSMFPVKYMFPKSAYGVYTATSGNQAANATNYVLLRYADVLLMAAECEMELGNLEAARGYVNQVRLRAKDGCYVMSLDNPNQPASNYKIEEYKTAWPDQDYARSAVRFERRLELALEGQRHFDLVRWGVADQVINRYLQKESQRPYKSYLTGATFGKNKNEYFPIPQSEIINSSINGKPVLTQNPGY